MSAAAIVATDLIFQRIEEQMTQPEPQPTKPASTKSKTVLMAMWIFAFALIGGLVAIGTPAVASLAIILALVAVGLTVLSLREDIDA